MAEAGNATRGLRHIVRKIDYPEQNADLCLLYETHPGYTIHKNNPGCLQILWAQILLNPANLFE
jgi:hypothetical protein